MNKRVEELAHQAGLDSFYVPEWSPWAEEFEKFAELVVRECASLAYDGPGGILDHFGLVEE